MRSKIRIALLALMSTFVLGAVVSAPAMASLTVEPFSTPFTAASTIATIQHEAAIIKCKLSYAGTSQSVAQNFIKATPSLTSCTETIGGTISGFKASSSCPKEGLVPWQITFTEIEGAKRADLKTECSLVLSATNPLSCTITAKPGTFTSAFRWEDGVGNNMLTWLENGAEKGAEFTYTSEGCAYYQFPPEGTFTLRTTGANKVAGIKVK